ncbi:MAG: TetR/AcrR family transcriptional regulator [Pseudomonadota bacterium]
MSAPGRRTRRQRVEEMEGAILSAAQAVFAREGFEGARLAEIARAAGVAEGTVYLYFENKNALYSAVLRSFYAELTHAAADGVARLSGTRERLDFLARHHLAHVGPAWKMFALMAYHARFSDDYRGAETWKLNRAYARVFDGVVREGAARGELRGDLPVGMLRDAFYGGLEFACRSALIRGEDPAGLAEALTPAFLEQFLAGAAAPAGAGPPEASRLERAAARLEKAAERLEAAGK